MQGICRAVDKYFDPCGKYAKGEGKGFRHHCNHYHEGALLVPIQRMTGTRNDAIMEGACAVYYNRWLYIDYLIEMSKSADSESLLLENLFIMLSSLEMIALTRSCAIVHFALILPMRWLAGKTHELAKYDWSVASMGRVYDILHEKLGIIMTDGSKFLDENFVMSIFDNLAKELPPFAEYLEYIFEMKENTTID